MSAASPAKSLPGPEESSNAAAAASDTKPAPKAGSPAAEAGSLAAEAGSAGRAKKRPAEQAAPKEQEDKRTKTDEPQVPAAAGQQDRHSGES